MKLGKFEITKVEKEVTEINEEAKEEKEMGFIGRHKKGLIIGGVATLLAGVGAAIMLNKSSDNEEDVEFDDDEIVDDETAE